MKTSETAYVLLLCSFGNGSNTCLHQQKQLNTTFAPPHPEWTIFYHKNAPWKRVKTPKLRFFGPPQAENFWGLEGLIRIPPLIRYKILLRGGILIGPSGERKILRFWTPEMTGNPLPTGLKTTSEPPKTPFLIVF